MSVVADSQKKGAAVCATCGQALTHSGPDGECVRCLVSFGFLAEDDEAERRSRGNRVRLGPLRYAHFEIEVNTDTPVVRHNRVEEIVFVLGGLTLAVLSVLYQLWFG